MHVEPNRRICTVSDKLADRFFLVVLRWMAKSTAQVAQCKHLCGAVTGGILTESSRAGHQSGPARTTGVPLWHGQAQRSHVGQVVHWPACMTSSQAPPHSSHTQLDDKERVTIATICIV